MHLRKYSAFLITIVLLYLFISPQRLSTQYIITADELPNEITEGDTIRIVATIFNNDSSAAVDLKAFNVTIRRIVGRYVPRPIRTLTKNLTGIRVLQNSSYTVFMEITFDLPPDRYNLTASFVVRKVGEYRDKVIYVWRSKEIVVKPKGVVPPEILFAIYLISAGVILFIGWLIAGIIKRK